MADWEVQRPEGTCAACGETLEPETEFFAALAQNLAPPSEQSAVSDQQSAPPPPFMRQDFCTRCWENKHPEVFSFWKTRMPAKKQKKKLFVDDGLLVNFFERLAEEEDPKKINFRFVLGLLLMRKKILKYIGTTMDQGRELWTMRFVGQWADAANQPEHPLLNPRLDDEQIQQVSEELTQILHSDEV